MQVQSLGQEDPLEEGMETHSSIIAWKIPWTRSLAGYSPWGRGESDMTEVTKHAESSEFWNSRLDFLKGVQGSF